MIKQKSLQRELRRWIILTALVFVLLGAIIAGGVAFYQTRELQDHTLQEIATLVSAGKLSDSATLHHNSATLHYNSATQHHNIETPTVIINELGKKQHIPIIPLESRDGLQTMVIDGLYWRVFIITQPSSKRRFSIAQQTKLRDKIAMSSSLSVFLPIVLLVIMMLLMINMIISKQFRSLGLLTKEIDQQDGSHLQKIPENKIPIEIAPFVHSINSLLARVRKTLQKQQRFIADAAHELRTPIAALSLQAGNLAQAKTSDDREDRQQNLQQGLKRLRKLVNQLLDLARLQNEKEHHTQKILFNEIVKNAMADLHPLAESSHIDLGMTQQEENIWVNDKQGRLGQLVFNAIDNAIHYTPSGGKVDISLFAENDKAVFVVEDNGIGIPEDELELVMQPFYRVEGKNKQPGNGLGLAISHEIAQLLGGDIILRNRVKGLRFRYQQLKLPE